MGAHKPPTLADFVAESMRHSIIVEDLPEGINASEAAARFGQMDNIVLDWLLPVEKYFFGWFDPEGREVRTTSGDCLFVINLKDFLKIGGYRLYLQPKARELLLAGPL